MNWKTIKIFAFLLVMLALSACGDDRCVRECDSSGKNCKRECGAGHCVEADDWGFPKVRVSAAANDLILTREPALNQYAEPIDSGQVILDANDIPLVITVGKRDQWTSWFGGDSNQPLDNGDSNPYSLDVGRTVPNQECLYYLPDDKKSPAGATTQISGSVFPQDLSPTVLKLERNVPKVTDNNPVTPYATPDLFADAAVPCYMRYGMGLFIGLAPNNGTNSRASDVVLTYHIPDAKRPDYAYNQEISAQKDLVDGLNLAAQARDGYLIRGLAKDELPGAQTGDRLYFKIVDNTYEDNSGGYTIKIKEGARDPSPGPLERIASLFIDPMMIVMNRMYNGIVNNSSYVNAVRVLLVLYMVFYGYVFIIGGQDEIKKQALERTVKMALVLVLISDQSWNFFYNHLFRAFFGGTQEIAGLLMSGTSGDYDPGNPWYSMDKVFAKFWSGETWAKIWSTLFSNYLGILFVPSMALAIGLFMLAAVQALIVYLLAFGGMAILVVIAPIFLLFMLFSQTKKLTSEWFDHLLTFALQQIILLAALGLFASVIVTFLERTIGYNVCWNIWHTLGIGPFSIYDFKFWMPDINASATGLTNLWLDSDGDSVKELVTRYADLPYFDPIYDKGQIIKYASERNFISLSDILLLLGSIFMMHNFMAIVPNIASTLKGGVAGDTMNIFQSGGKLVSSLFGAATAAAGEAKNAVDTLGNAGSRFAQNSETRHAAQTAKRAGIMAGNNIKAGASAAASKASAWMGEKLQNSALGKQASAAGKEFNQRISSAGKGLSDRALNAKTSLNQRARALGHKFQDLVDKEGIGGRASAAQKQMAALANTRQQAEQHRTMELKARQKQAPGQAPDASQPGQAAGSQDTKGVARAGIAPSRPESLSPEAIAELKNTQASGKEVGEAAPNAPSQTQRAMEAVTDLEVKKNAEKDKADAVLPPPLPPRPDKNIARAAVAGPKTPFEPPVSEFIDPKEKERQAELDRQADEKLATEREEAAKKLEKEAKEAAAKIEQEKARVAQEAKDAEEKAKKDLLDSAAAEENARQEAAKAKAEEDRKAALQKVEERLKTIKESEEKQKILAEYKKELSALQDKYDKATDPDEKASLGLQLEQKKKDEPKQ